MTSSFERRVRMQCVECAGCLLWTGAMASGNAPSMRWDDGDGMKTVNLRRELWKRTKGPVPDDAAVVAACEKPNCLLHLEAIPRAEQVRRAAVKSARSESRRRRVSKTKRATSRWTDEDLAALRTTDDVPGEARRLGMNESYAYRVRNGTMRRDFTNPFATGLGARNTERS